MFSARSAAGLSMIPWDVIPPHLSTRTGIATFSVSTYKKEYNTLLQNMSMFESGESSGKVSLAGLFEKGVDVQMVRGGSLEGLAWMVVR